MARKRPLTEKQQKFLDVLFEDARGSLVEAKKLAGYSETQNTSEITNALREEILDRTNMYLAQNAPRAAMAIVGAIVDPTELGIKEKMQAAKEIMDRVGIVKSEKIQVESSGGVMILPPKKKENDDD
jgi:DNA-binding Lrp family transcriptional regulator